MAMKWMQSDPGTLIANIQAFIPEEVMPALVEAVDTSVQEGAALQQKILDQATTTYGEQRFGRGRGRSAGRNDTGTMMDAVDSGTDVQGNTVTGWWGWEDPEEYFIDQEWGIGNPPPANSLQGSFVPTREKAKARIDKLAKG